jgi:hypothetical protein
MEQRGEMQLDPEENAMQKNAKSEQKNSKIATSKEIH